MPLAPKIPPAPEHKVVVQLVLDETEANKLQRQADAAGLLPHEVLLDIIRKMRLQPTRVVSVRLRPAEEDALDDRAKEAGLARTVYLRHLILKDISPNDID